jgi:hypothetical protein
LLRTVLTVSLPGCGSHLRVLETVKTVPLVSVQASAQAEAWGEWEVPFATNWCLWKNVAVFRRILRISLPPAGRFP